MLDFIIFLVVSASGPPEEITSTNVVDFVGHSSLLPFSIAFKFEILSLQLFAFYFVFSFVFYVLIAVGILLLTKRTIYRLSPTFSASKLQASFVICLFPSILRFFFNSMWVFHIYSKYSDRLTFIDGTQIVFLFWLTSCCDDNKISHTMLGNFYLMCNALITIL